MTAFVFREPIGNPPSIEWVRVADLSIDPRYQRSIDNSASQKLIGEIANEWDWRLCVPLLVSRREGRLFVIDGQHRLEGARQRGDLQHLPCCISSYESAAEEALLFVRANRKRRAMSRLDDFHAAVAANDAVARTIHELVVSAGLGIAEHVGHQSWGPGELACTSGLRTALKRHGAKILGVALMTIGQAFAGQTLRYGGVLVSGLVLVHARGRVDHIPLQRALRTRTADQWGEHPLVVAERGGDIRAKGLFNAVMEEVDRQAQRSAAPAAIAPASTSRPAPISASGISSDQVEPRYLDHHEKAAAAGTKALAEALRRHHPERCGQ